MFVLKRIILAFTSIVLMICVLAGCGTAQPQTTETTELSYEPPKGFVADETIEGLYRSPDYPDDMSNIVVSTDTRTADFDDMDKEYFKENCLEILAYTADVDADTIDYTVTTAYVAGYKAVKTTVEFVIEPDASEFEAEATEVKQIQYAVFVDDSDVLWLFTLTQVGDNDWEKAFESSINGK